MKIKIIQAAAFFLTIFGFAAGYSWGDLQNRPAAIVRVNQAVAGGRQALGSHYSFGGQKNFFEEAYKNTAAKKVIAKSGTEGLIVPHHLVASRLIAVAFASVATDKPLTVVLISPNHFFAGKGQIITSLYDWQTPYGVLEADQGVIKRLQADGAVNVDEGPFANEHGIADLAAFVKKSLPNSRIVPVIIKDTLSEAQGDGFAAELAAVLPQNSLVVGSFDFSHYLPSPAADFHDAKSIAVLSDFDYDGIKFLDVDSKPGLRIFLKYLDAQNARQFALLDNSNSAKIIKDDSIPETTSYITGQFFGGEKEIAKQTTLLAFGDLMLDRYIKKTIDKYGVDYPFKNIERFLAGNDLTMANLEGSFTDFLPRPLDPNNATFTFDPALVPGIKKLGFNIFSLANNHSQDYGPAGIAQSQANLDKNGIDHFGDFMNNGKISIIENIRGIKIGFVGYNEFSNTDIGMITQEIKEVKRQSDFTVVFAHWGIEYQTNFSQPQQDRAHQFIDAGADIVLGVHPHVVQPIEIYKGKLIFYSLGNFVFDQIFSQDVQQGLAVGTVFDKSKIELYLFPMQNKNFQVYFADKANRDIILDKLAKLSLVPENIKSQVRTGKITINLK
jgi:poly-gamma-glutamate synthesis protein (capsule biosynthesis protein)